MKKHKRSRTAISLFLAVCTLFSLILPVTAAEEEGLSYEVIIDPQYEDADSFSQDLAAVKKNGKWGYIDTEGNTVIPFQFDYAFPFSEAWPWWALWASIPHMTAQRPRCISGPSWTNRAM